MARVFFLAAFFLSACLQAWAGAPGRVMIDSFSGGMKDGFPPGWQTASFVFTPRMTDYTVVEESENMFLRAESRNSASAIYKEVSIDPRAHPILTWRWKILNTIAGGDETIRSGDDYAARIYVSFEFRPERVSAFEALERGLIRTVYGKELPGEALVYVWANRLPRNRAVPNPDTPRAMMIAVESGMERAGNWLLEGRNVYEDYKKYFKGEPPMISHVAIMTDTDNTGEEALAFFDDIAFHAGDAGKGR